MSTDSETLGLRERSLRKVLDMKAFLVQRWFLIALAFMMAVGFLGTGSARMAPLIELANSITIRYGVVAVVLFLMALPLEARAMWRTIRQPGPPLLGVAMNSIALPLFTWSIVALLGDRWLSRDMALGLARHVGHPLHAGFRGGLDTTGWRQRCGEHHGDGDHQCQLFPGDTVLALELDWPIGRYRRGADDREAGAVRRAADGAWRSSSAWFVRSAAGPHDIRCP